ncbi:E3 ubiquitin-protein ligase BOI-like [Daucus carota subsp. sativus]|uniref:E3 ubiquitin-protein ligase BOI-like n=1 Tax=Daucus carota subsp. sativus TaxID=79200 RepID=UPI003083ED38
MGKLNAALQKNVKNLLDVNEAWTEYAISCEIKAASVSNKLEVTTRKSQFGNNQAAAGLNNHVQMGSANPFATTVDKPWLGINHMLLGSKTMVIQPQQVNETVPAHIAPANMQLPDGERKRSRESSTTNEAKNLHNVNFPVPNFAPPQIRDEMIALRESDRLLCQQVLTGIVLMQSKRLRVQFAEKQNQALQHLVNSVRGPLLNLLKQKDVELSNFKRLNCALHEGINDLYNENQKLSDCAGAWKIKAVSLYTNLEVAMGELRRLQGLVPAIGAVEAPHEEQEAKSYSGSNVSAENTPGNSQEWQRQKMVKPPLRRQTMNNQAVAAFAEKVKIGMAETGEGSGEKKKCMLCDEFELSVLAWPCWHLCFCIVCGTPESRLQGGPCPVCGVIIKAAVPVSII